MVKSVLIANDQESIRRALCRLFAAQDDFDVCGDAENGLEAIEMAQLLNPDLILLGLSMPMMTGVEAACELKRLMPMVPIIVFSEYDDAFLEREARATGISALISETERLSMLLDKARSVLFPAAA